MAPAQLLEMQPGERVRLSAAQGEALQVDRPRLEQLPAWQRNEAVFDGATLAEAVAEMNQYGRTPLVLADDLARSDQRISGQFRTGDNVAFPRALAVLHGLTLHEQQGRLELSRQP
jgi:transmembrane sensor